MHFIYLVSCCLLPTWVRFAPTAGYSLGSCVAHGSLNYTNRLKVLCYSEQLRLVPSNIPPNVTVLDISDNLISRIQLENFRNLSNLRVLNVSRNLISRVAEGAFKHLVNLQELNMARNKLSVLSENIFEGLGNLTVLQLGDNNIKSVESTAFRFLLSIRFVNLTTNELQHLNKVRPILKFPHLQQLHVGNNSLFTFQTEDLSDFPLALKVLDLSWNPLTKLNVTTDILPKLESLDLSYSGTNGSEEWYIRDGFLLRDVKKLSLNGTNISEEVLFSVLQCLNSSLEVLTMSNLKHLKVKAFLNVTCQMLPLLRVFNLQGNSLGSLGDGLKPCSLLRDLDLSRNKLVQVADFVFKNMSQLHALNLSYNQLNAVPVAVRIITSLETLDLSYNSISELKSSDFAKMTMLKELYLVNNLIRDINGSAFQDLINLRSLRLGKNHIWMITYPMFLSLRKLVVLDLKSNQLSSLKNGTFQNLNSLKSLNLVDNQISEIEEGAFQGLLNLTTLLLGSNKITGDILRTGTVFSGMPALRELQLFDNFISYESTAKLKSPPFSLLKSLKTLSLNSQGHEGLLNLPSNFLEGLGSLIELHAGRLNINFLHPQTFSYTPKLSFLDISRNAIGNLTPQLFQPIPNLTEFILTQGRLQTLDFLIHANLTQVKILRAKGNELTVITESLIRSLPSVKYVDLRENSFSCDCDNSWFLKWALHDTYAQVIYMNTYFCKYPPNLRGMKLIDLKMDSCSVDLEFICFISSTTLVALTLLASFFYRFLRWQVVYAYYLFLAFLYDNRKKRRRPVLQYQYDAFVSYNTHDELWVLRELLPNLEQVQGWRLCLHHRDFEAGKPIIDNIVDSIYNSRKTICLISRHYLESEWCSREIQVASFRLFDEQKDVLILVFLEDIPACQLSPYHRMRKLVKKRTYLKWPGHREETRMFWHKLNIALQTRGEADEENPLLSGLDTQD
ncbi:toll-like receptor 22 isoform X1 [Lepisosteus oculatus]|uniref:toll-like receptor 22 isoform X1 n=1 Tax=Lepisosteus oculatus TaxID=7918 RepID=UPI0035F513F5